MGRLQEIQNEFQTQMDDGPAMVQLGDASIASPFTSKSPSILTTTHIIKQGRCTLTTTLQMYKILALNCLISAYMLSSLYLHGIKQGDQQATVFGLAIAIYFFLMSRSKPAKKLAPERPPSNIFCGYFLLSVFGQFCVHMYSLLYVVNMCEPYVDPTKPEMKRGGDFKPNIINSAVFLVSVLMQVNTFATNYCGMPWMESLYENKGLFYALGFSWCSCTLAATDSFPILNDALELTTLPTNEFRNNLLMVMLIDTAAVHLIEFIVRRVFLPPAASRSRAKIASTSSRKLKRE